MSRFAKLVNAKVSREQTPQGEGVSPSLEPENQETKAVTLNTSSLNEHTPPTSPTDATPPTPPTTHTPPTPRTPRTARTPRTPHYSVSAIAPERDFTRVANSILREGVAGGHFTGKSKQLYDYLYTRTRGAVVPTKSVKITKPSLMKGAHIGSERTLLKNIQHLKSIRLIEVDYTDGKHDGNTYTIFLPEEVGLGGIPTPPTPPTEGTPRHAGQKVVPVPPVESGVGGVGTEPVESSIYGESNTSLYKTIENDDDEALAEFSKTLRRAAEEVTGKSLSASDRHRWTELAEVLVTELKIAAGRTTVSSAPAFLAEHLRRRLWKKDKRQIEAEVNEQKTADPYRKADASQCPDCFGTRMYYPEGFDKGVAKCPHSKLLAENEE